MAALAMILGDYRQFQLAVTKGGVPVDLAGVQELTFTLQATGGGVFVQWGLTNGVIVNDPTTDGMATLSVTPAMQAALPSNVFQSLLYRWSLVDAFGNPSRQIEQGSFTFIPPPPGA